MKTRLDPRSLLLGAIIGAAAILCLAAAQSQTPDGQKPEGRAPRVPTPQPAVSAPTTAPADLPPEQVTGIGGVFFKAKDPKAMLAWYRANLGFPARGTYADFKWREKDQPDHIGHTAWRIFPTNTTYFAQSTGPLMINYRVANLDRMLAQLRKNGTTIEKTQDFDYGRWAWITDPEGNRIELWEPKQN